MTHKECRYCDGGFYGMKVGDDIVCANCGAEWNPVIVEDGDEE